MKKKQIIECVSFLYYIMNGYFSKVVTEDVSNINQ